MNTTILELSQGKSENTYSNGDWKTNLSKEIKIEQGDEISIKNVFLDTVSQSTGDIQIEKDIILNVKTGLYLNNWDENDKTYGDNSDVFKPDGYDYILCYYNTPASALTRWTGVTYTRKSLAPPDEPSNLQAIFTYEDPSGNTQKLHQAVAKAKIGHKKTLPVGDGSGILVTPNTIKLTNEKDIEKWYTYKLDTQTVNPGGKEVFHPVIYDSSFNLPAGNYQPQLLAQKLSDLFSASSYEKHVDALASTNFLKTIGQIRNQHSAYQFVRFDGREMFNFGSTATNDDYYVGTSQFQFNFDEETRKFSVDFIHMPQYDNNGNIVVIYKDRGGNTNPKIFSSGKNSGIFFTSLEAEDLSGNKYDFWQEKLGFTISDLAVDFKTIESTFTFFTTIVDPYLTIPTNFENGVKITTGFKGLDQIVQKNNNFQKEPSLPLTAETNAQTNIIATDPYQDSTVTDSHYLVEVRSNYKNNFINSDNIINTITGIVNRYYGFESFTASGAEASIPYVHKGEPVYLKSFDIRILDPSTMNVPPIGEKNYVYLSITKRSPTS